MKQEHTISREPRLEEDRPGIGGPLVPVGLPAALPPLAKPPPRGRWAKRLVAIAVLLVVGLGGLDVWRQSQTQLPPGIASGNGRLEADEIDIDTKYAGRIATLLADEGDLVKAGQVLALMDTRDLEASLRKSEAVVLQLRQSLDGASASVEQQKTQVLLAQQEIERAHSLVPKGFMPRETLDQRQQQLDGAVAALNAAKAKVGEAEHALDAASHDVELYKVEIADNSLVAPRDGRIQYRVANVGEVLGAGGRVFTMLDVSYVYMDIYLPTLDAGRVKIGSDARIALDAYPKDPIPSKVVFLASQAQFTPKTVETKDERDKLMFRIRLRIDPEVLRNRGDEVRSGLPGVGYIRTDPAAAWPIQLRGAVSE
ncbi:MAG TPA: HlyD family efflux transporter periplasmic adaptor subunit [Stellaceae bacterium]|nr:HlyD family efflux transporter periplasmic adaptor subunit [Stellaceae bacterium]